MREKSGSSSTIEEMWKRRKEKGEREEKEVFRSSKKTMR